MNSRENLDVVVAHSYDASFANFDKPSCIFNNVRTCSGLYIKSGPKLKYDFHALYKSSPESRKSRDRQKLRRKDARRGREKRKKADLASLNSCSSPTIHPIIELPGNPSSFAVYAQVRSLVLENVTRQAQSIYLSTTQPHPTDSDSESDTDRLKDSVVEIPKIVGLGLVSVYELIRGSVNAYPALCIRALEALLDILQGQQPEALSKEAPEVIDTLFNLLLRLATASNGDVLTCPSSPLVGVACACLLSLVVARGETGKFLRATADILMTSRQLASQNIQVPIILTLLQRSVHAILLGKTIRPDWMHLGIPTTALIEKFSLKMLSENVDDKYSMACDGHYLYIHSQSGLYKIGSGFGGTNKGHIYLHRPDFYPCQTGWLGFAHDDLLFRPGDGSCELMVVDREVLKVTEVSQCSERGWERGLAFSDGSCIGNIVPDKEDGFVIRTYNPQVKPMPMISEVGISLAEKCIQVLGGADGEACLAAGLEEDLVFIAAGKDFLLGRTASGKVHYSGKGSSVGMKHSIGGGAQHNTNADSGAAAPPSALGGPGSSGGTPSAGKWPELGITKAPRIVHLAVGHEGQHALLVADDGTPFFVGTAKRGEDGDGNKVRRQPKAVKPKKMVKMEGQFVVFVSCNNGTSALVTRDGELYMFGKDTFNCDQTCGLVTELKDVHVASVALGKAHVVALTNKGHVYTFGINNKGQCGRDFAPHSKDPGDEGPPVPMSGVADDEYDDDEGNESGEEIGECSMCPSGRHKWARDSCMMCTICHECTGYGAACVSSGRPDRNPGTPCGCGTGDSGCSECGCCRSCADEVEGEGEGLSLMHMQPLGLIPDVANLGGNFFSPAVGRGQDQLLPRVDQRRSHGRGRQGRYASAGSRKTMDEGIGSDQEKDTSKIVAISPARVHVPNTSAVVQVACGLHHSIVLCSNGEVYTWGSNSYGQLGTGDLQSHGSPTLIRLPPMLRITSVAAGSNHSVLLTSSGQIYTFGSFQKGQLGRRAPQYDAGEGSSRGRSPWYAVPSAVPGIGPRMGKRATWIGASADSTFVKLDQSLINAYNLQASNVVANSNCLILLPVGRKAKKDDETWKCLVISRSEGNCKSFSSDSQVDFTGHTVCLDSVYNVIWSFKGSTHELKCYNIIAGKAQRIPKCNLQEGLRDILSSELSLPVVPDFQLSRAQVALHMVSCIDTITWGHENGLSVTENDPQSVSVSRVYTKEDFNPVNRFESHGGGWGYSGHSIEAIRFMCDTDVLVGGFGLFGGRGQYLGKIKLFELGVEGGEQESDGEILAENEEMPYECGARQKFPMLFDEPVSIQANKWYVAWARVSGPSSDCGSSGQSMITTEDQVIFYFKSSKKSNNGTDVNAGQIPQILYRITSSESNLQARSSSAEEPIPILSRKFYINVTNDVFQSLLDLLNWSWETLCTCIAEQVNISGGGSGGHIVAKLDLQRLVYICCACLRLLRIYINEIYPNSVKSNRSVGENEHLAESVAEVRALLRRIMTDPLPTPTHHASPNISRRGKHRPSKSDPSSYSKMIISVLDECHSTFVACFHAFYPTGQLKWSCLCDLLLSRDEGCEESHASDRLLSAVLASLCSPSVKLRATCPILTDHETEGAQKPSPADNAALSTLQPGDLYRYPVLVEHMTYKIQAGNGVGIMWTFREVLDRLLGVMCGGVRQALRGERVVPLPSLVQNTCLFLSAAVAELAAETATFESEVPASGRVLHVTPCRFTRMSQSRTWSTGNGSPDAICFSVDRHGVLVAGVCVYGGVGTYDYEVELMDESLPNSASGSAAAQDGAGPGGSSAGSSHGLERWNVIEVVRGTFGPDDSVMDIVEIKFDRPVPIKQTRWSHPRVRLRSPKPEINTAIEQHIHGGRHTVAHSSFRTHSFITAAREYAQLTVPPPPSGFPKAFTNPFHIPSTMHISGSSTLIHHATPVHSVQCTPFSLLDIQTCEGTKYAIRLTNRGGRTSNGDAGLASVRGPDGTNFCFSACSLSVNGTNQIRGQIPQILYFSTPQDPENQETTKEIAEHQARKSALTMVGSILRAATELMIMGLGIGDDTAVDVLSSAPIITMLLPLLLAHIKPVAISDPRSAVSVIGLIQEVLPHVSALNNLSLATQKSAVAETLEECHTTTSHHYAWVESDHPYKPSTVSNQKVTFPPSVQWMALEFDPQCGTAQPEDTLQIYIPAFPRPKLEEGCSTPDQSDRRKWAPTPVSLETKVPSYWPVMGKLSGTKNWPQHTIALPGNELVFSLETASDYVKDEKASTFGFRALVIGYEWPPSPPDSLRHLEKELSYLGGLCAASLIKKTLVLPPIPGEDPEEDMQAVEDVSMQVYLSHPSLLSKGFALSHPPTIHQTLDGVIPFSCHSNERLFLRDFVSCSGGTSGGRLARWLQPDSYVDVRGCEVLYSRDDMRAGWPALVTIITRDQYNEVVHAPTVKVEVTAVPVTTGEEGSKGKLKRFSQHVSDNMTFGGHPQPSLDIPYQVSIKDKMCYCAITMMKGYENYSFEELRYVSPTIRRPTENMLVRSNSDGSYSCNWTPGSTGWYSLNIKVDGYPIEKTYKLEVKEPPQGVIPPVQNSTKKPPQQPSRLRKFALQNSSGLRIRTHPSLQSEQLGVVHVNGTIAFVDEIHNSDGVWLKLSSESIRQYCSEAQTEAWCLQYNQHLGKTLLVPLDQPKTILDQVITDTISRRGGQGHYPGRSSAGGRSVDGSAPSNSVYTVIKCGASGHNIRSKASLKAPPVGMLVLGNTFTVDSEIKNAEGTWVRLDCESTRKYCFTDGDAWSLAVSKGHTLYLQCSQPHKEAPPQENPMQQGGSEPSGFDFTQSQVNPVFKSFQPSNSADKTPFVFGSAIGSKEMNGVKDVHLDINKLKISGHEDDLDKDGLQQSGKFSLVNRWLKEGIHKKSPPIDRKRPQTSPVVGSSKDIPPELQGVSVKELVKAIGESRANGNGATPPRTPPATPKRVSRSSSPRATLCTSRHSSRGSSPVPIPGRDRESLGSSSIHSSPRGGVGSFVSIEENERSPLEEKLPPEEGGSVPESASDTSIMVSSLPQDASPSHSGASALSTPRKAKSVEATSGTLPKTMTQSSTQTSPEGVKFSIGSNSSKDEASLRVSPKNTRKDRGSKPLRGKRERPVSPGGALQRERVTPGSEKVREAMSPSVAECLRAVFAAFLWHEGIVHDAMACASYLKFHPDLTKQGTFLWKLCQAKPVKTEAKLTKEQKARQRHSVEVSAYSYLNVTVQNKDDFSKVSPNDNVVVEKSAAKKTQEAPSYLQGAQEAPGYLQGNQDTGTTSYMQGNQGTQEIPSYLKGTQEAPSYLQGPPPPGYKLATVMESGSTSGAQDTPELPLVLRHVVLLWEDLASSCLKAIAQQLILPSPTAPARLKKEKTREKEKKKNKKKPLGSSKQMSEVGADEGGEEELGGQCELCGQVVPHHSSEQHFIAAHPGCGGASHGCGYVGTRWKFFPSKDRLPLPCGEVFRGCYHMCWSCRNKFKGQSPSHLNMAREMSRKNKRKSGVRLLSPLPNVETHVVMRDNAMFLLDLASASSSHILTRPHGPRKSPCPMPCVSELSPDSSPFPKVAFQCLHTLNCQQQHLNQLREDHLLHQHHQLHSSDTTTTTGTTTNGYYSSSGDSKENHRDGVSYSPGHSHQESPASDPEVSWRPFHRSISVTVGPSGQDWSSSAAIATAAQNDSITHRSGVVLRKRNNSSSENAGTGVTSLLAHPSAALEKLMSQMTPRVGVPPDPAARGRQQVIVRPIMAFIFQNHDLESLAYAMRHATRKAAARVYAMQALNWLLQSVTQPTCLHDLLWCFVTALTPPSPFPQSDEPQPGGEYPDKYRDVDGEIVVLEHPLSDVTLSGDAIHPLPQTFHQLLQTIADLMMLLPPGSPLQMMAVRCWGLRFSPSDHDFLHQSHVFSNISKILSRSEEVLGGADDGTASLCDSHAPATSQVVAITDLTALCEVKASSRQAMVSSLTDASTETFWESGDEDRNKTKVVTINCPAHVSPRAVYVHIDNCRDLGNKVSSATFKCGSSLDDVSVIQQVEIETRYAGWVHTYLPTEKPSMAWVLAELRGPDQSVRVRQIRVLGVNPSTAEKNWQQKAKSCSPVTLQHRMCEQETLKVFRLITGQVFGRLLNNATRPKELGEGAEEEVPPSPSGGTEDADHNNDLREHMVGILFSRSKLNHLQKQVCSHIVQAIKKEAKRARDEWEAGLLSGVDLQATPATPEEGQHSTSDTYCFEMLSMVLALSGSPVGRAHLAHQENLLKHLLSLLHTGSARVQRQVVSLFRRMLVDISPSTLAQVLGVPELPPLDLTIIQMPAQENEEPFDMHKQGILDVFLSVIAKSLVVQIKNKSSDTQKTSPIDGPSTSKPGITSVTLSNAMPKPQSNSNRWWMQGGATRKLADLIISLIRDMTNGCLTEEWSQVSKGAIASNIINLTRLSEKDRGSASTCLTSPTLWLSLASLCVLHPDHIDALSSQQWRAAAACNNADNAQPHLRPMCENHDDGSTCAMILCDSCGNLCGECDRILHLHRRTRSHHRTVFREEQQAIKVDLHEGCGRAKLFWLLALADSTTLKAMMELRSENSRTREGNSGTSACRFCGSPAQTSLLSPIPVCQDQECQEYSRDACTRMLECNHVCSGVKGEVDCLPCLLGCSSNTSLKQDADDMCMICFSEALAAAPCVQLECGHVFHLHCCRSVLSKRWPGPRITFTFSLCPICKVAMKHWSVSELLHPISVLYEDVRRKALMRLEYEGLLKAEAVSSPGARYHNDPASYAMDRYAYYVCFKCSKAYYGGEARCENDLGSNDDYDPRELVCGACSDVSRAQMCPKHGTDFLEYKCRYCCSVAVFFCFGTTHFCNACHEDFQRVTNIPKAELPHCPAGPRAQQLAGDECPLHVQHPLTGEEFALGCGVCRNAHTF